jgi:hypothetical protein
MAGTAGLRRDEGAGAPPIELGAQPIIVEGLVAEQSVDPDAVVALAGQKNEAYEIAERVDHCDDLGGQATSRPANGLISSLPFAPMPCWWTRTIVPSMVAYSKCGSPDKASKRLSNTPFKVQRQKRRKTEFQSPNGSGSSRQGAPVRAIQKHGFEEEPVVGRRSSGIPGLAGKERSHCESFNTLRIKADHHFSALNQISQQRGIFGVGDSSTVELCGHRLFAKAKEPFLRGFLKLENGVPSHDTFSRLFRRLDPERFRAAFQRFMAGFSKRCEGVVAIDGKVLRRSFDSASRKSPLHMVSAWGCEQRLVLARIATDTKSNEITAEPKLLEMLTLKGAIVTADALNCQRAIARHCGSGRRICPGLEG